MWAICGSVGPAAASAGVPTPTIAAAPNSANFKSIISSLPAAALATLVPLFDWMGGGRKGSWQARIAPLQAAARVPSRRRGGRYWRGRRCAGDLQQRRTSCTRGRSKADLPSTGNPTLTQEKWVESGHWLFSLTRLRDEGIRASNKDGASHHSGLSNPIRSAFAWSLASLAIGSSRSIRCGRAG